MRKHENAHYGDMPSVHQVTRLNSQLILYASRHDKLAIKEEKPGIKKFRISQTDRYECPGILDGAPFGYLYKESLGALATHDLLDNRWALKIIDGFHAIELGSGRGGQRTTYRFEWDNETVTLAERKSIAVPDTRRGELTDIIDHFYLPDDAAWVPEMQDATEYVTAGDIEYFIGSLASRIARVDSGEEAYNEPRKPKYMDYFAD